MIVNIERNQDLTRKDTERREQKERERERERERDVKG